MSRIIRRRPAVVSSRLKAFSSFLDTFSSLKTSWKPLRGTWLGAAGTGSTSTSASSYPLAVVKMSKSNVTASVKSTANGAGIAIWATDSGNWWGVVTGQNSAADCNCQTCSQCNAYQCNSYQCNAYQCNAWQCNASQCNSWYYVCNYWVPQTCQQGGGYCTGYNSNNCAGWNASYCNAYSSYNGYLCGLYGTSCGQCNSWNASYCASWNGTNCQGYNAIYYYNCTGGYCGASASYCNASSCTSSSCASASCTSSSCASASCSSTSYYACNCQTCYPATIRVLKSASNIVTEMTSWVVNTVVNSLKVVTSGNNITAKAYSDNNLTTQIGSDLTYTATGAMIDTKFGIVVAPSTYSQGATLGQFEVTSN